MCLTPISIKNKERMKRNGSKEWSHHAVPCGKCPDCIRRRINSWSFRLLKEDKVHANSLFITLTYSPENVPITPNGFMTLQKSDFQKFMKRLRKNTGCKTIKYYACGEYGGQTYRPHYHAIIYDVTEEQIYKAWQLGYLHLGTMTGNSIAYTAKYIDKPKRIPMHAKDDRVPEFSLMSKGLGKNYIESKDVQNWHLRDLKSYVVVEGGFKQALPRYYRDKLFNSEQRQEIRERNEAQYNEDLESKIAAAGDIEKYMLWKYEYLNNLLTNNSIKKNNERNKI